MRVDLDAKVKTRDGEDAGSVMRAIVDPETNEVTHFVVTTGALLGKDVIVPREDLEAAAREGDSIRLSITKEEFKNLPEYVPVDYTPPPPGWIPLPAYGYPPYGYLWPASPTPQEVEARIRREEGGEAGAKTSLNINKGTVVVDRDGDEVGVVEDISLDPNTGKLLGLVIKIGGALERLLGSADTTEIPGDAVERIEPGAIYLKLDKDEIK